MQSSRTRERGGRLTVAIVIAAGIALPGMMRARQSSIQSSLDISAIRISDDRMRTPPKKNAPEGAFHRLL
ncbi:hypothetical protein ACQUJT_17605 [Ralstonia pseudosolanacearum]